VTPSEVDYQEIVQDAVVILENTLFGQGEGTDANLTIALNILRDYRPEISGSTAQGEPSQGLEREIIKVWNQALDPQITGHAQPTGLRRGTLFVTVDSQVWLSEIVRYRRKAILSRLQDSFGHELIERVSYRTGEGQREHIHFEFALPEQLLRISSIPETPCYFNANAPCSAQRYMREALQAAMETKEISVSFRSQLIQTSAEEFLPDSQTAEFEKLLAFWEEVAPGFSLNERGKFDLRNLMLQFGVDEIREAIRKAANYYLVFEDGKVTTASAGKAWGKVGGICCVQRVEKDRPYIGRLYYIRAILRRRFQNLDEREALNILIQAADLKASLDSLETHAKTAENYERWRLGIEKYIAEYAQKS
jgi:hypothetical protein